MRVKKTIILFLLLAYALFFRGSVLAESCGGTSCGSCSGHCGTQSCTYSEIFTSYEDGCRICTYTCWDQSTVNPDPNEGYWTPSDYPDVTCTNTCRPTTCEESQDASCIYETAEVVCNCDQDPTPTPTPGGGGGGSNSTPAPAKYPIKGNIQKDLGASLIDNFCNQLTDSPLSIPGISLYAYDAYKFYSAYIKANNFTINTSYNDKVYKVVLDLSAQTGPVNYACSCPAASDPDNPYLCAYYGVNSPTENVNFYLKEYNLASKSWFQVFGGNIFAKTKIASPIPYSFCSIDQNCEAAVLLPYASSLNSLVSGFPLVGSSLSTNLRSSLLARDYHSHLHLANRVDNVNSYSTSTDLTQLSYDYFYKLVENSTQKIGNGEDLEPLLSDWTNSSWWNSNDVNFIKVDGNVSIDETQGFNLSSGQKLVVFVDGNLTFDDSNPNDTNYKITSVAQGGFLAFFASKNILITPNVGYPLDPSIPFSNFELENGMLNPGAPTPKPTAIIIKSPTPTPTPTPVITIAFTPTPTPTPVDSGLAGINSTQTQEFITVSLASSNLEGVFVANNDLIVQTKSAIGELPPDRKFIGAGTFVGWHNVLLNRTFEDSANGYILNKSQAVDNFVYRPDLLINWPTKLKASISNWREIDPQLINQ